MADRPGVHEPLVIEHAHVRQALDALKGSAAPVSRPSGSGARGRVAVKTKAGPARCGRPQGGGIRAQEALELVERAPWDHDRRDAARMKTKPNYRYRVLPQLEKAGQIRKHEKDYQKADG
jgi:hypothetical protein